MANAPSIDDVTIGVVTVLPEELAATCELLGCHDLVEVQGRNYRVGNLKRFDRVDSHAIAVCSASDMGTASASARTAILLRDCKSVRLVIMSGIAGAVPNPRKPSDHVRLGDIVVLNRRGVVQYDFIKESEKGTQLRERWLEPSRQLLDATQQLALQERLGTRPWEAYIREGMAELSRKHKGTIWRRPPNDTDQLREFDVRRPLDYLTRVARFARLPGSVSRYGPIPHPFDEQRFEGLPRVFHGVIASANNLQKNPARRDFLGQTFGAKAVEMEGSGVGDATYEADARFFVVRGTCDYCNGDKNDDWHHYAAVAAAAYTRALLELVPVQPRLVPPGIAVVPTRKMNTVHAEPVAQAEGAPLPQASAAAATDALHHDELLDRALNEVLPAQTERSLRTIETWLDAREFENAFAEAQRLALWIDTASHKLPKALVRNAYEWLARVEVIKGRLNDDVPASLEKAEQFIARARNVAD